MENNKYLYVLFGEEACTDYSRAGVDSLCENGYVEGGSLHKYEEGVTPITTILEDADGWVEYMYLTEEEYNTIKAKED